MTNDLWWPHQDTHRSRYCHHGPRRYWKQDHHQQQKDWLPQDEGPKQLHQKCSERPPPNVQHLLPTRKHCKTLHARPDQTLMEATTKAEELTWSRSTRQRTIRLFWMILTMLPFFSHLGVRPSLTLSSFEIPASCARYMKRLKLNFEENQTRQIFCSSNMSIAAPVLAVMVRQSQQTKK